MASFGFYEQEHPGEICPSDMAHGGPSQADFIGGSRRESGNKSFQPCSSQAMPQDILMERSIVLIAPCFVPISMPREQKGGSKSRGIRQEAGRFQYQSASACGRQR